MCFAISIIVLMHEKALNRVTGKRGGAPVWYVRCRPFNGSLMMGRNGKKGNMGGGMQFLINGKSVDMNRVDEEVTAGDTEI